MHFTGSKSSPKILLLFKYKKSLALMLAAHKTQHDTTRSIHLDTDKKSTFSKQALNESLDFCNRS